MSALTCMMLCWPRMRICGPNWKQAELRRKGRADMTDDLVKKLRNRAAAESDSGICLTAIPNSWLHKEAADHIEALTAERDALRAEVARLRGVLSTSRDCIRAASGQLTKKNAKALRGEIWGWWYLEQIDAALREGGE